MPSSLDVPVRELRAELREHRAPQLEPFVGEVAAVLVVLCENYVRT
jgi:hypothetical protein